MNIILSALIVILSILAILINQWVSLVPQLGIGFQYHRRVVQIMIAILTIGIASGLYLNNPTVGQLLILLVVLLLTPLSGFNHASKVLVPVDQPEQVPASEADWSDSALVLGYAADEQTACAWLLETLIPHHLVNDTVDGEPLLAAW